MAQRCHSSWFSVCNRSEPHDITTVGLVPGTKMAEEFSGGIVYIVSGLKTFVETGAPMTAAAAAV